jgi:hypothetical protein
MYCRFLTHPLAEFDQTICGRGNTAGKTTIQETVRQHKTKEEKPTTLPNPPQKGEIKRFTDFSILHEARALRKN